MRSVPNKVVVLIALLACFLSIAGPCNGRGEPVVVTVTSVPVWPLPGPPTELMLTTSGANDLRLNYAPSDWVHSATHYYRFELERSSSEDGVYQHRQTINYSGSPAYFRDELMEGYWYRARGQRCTTNERLACGAWSDYSAPVKTPLSTPEPTGSRENLAASESYPFDILAIHALYQTGD